MLTTEANLCNVGVITNLYPGAVEMTSAIPVDRLRELFSYEPDIGKLTWRTSTSHRIKIGDEAGAVATNGRLYVGVDGYRVLAHRIVWAIAYGEWPEGNVAPSNGDYLDIRLSNLKLETAAETARKGGLRKGNKSGSRGVSWDASRGRWIATITRDYKMQYLGRFINKEEASAAYVAAAEKYGIAAASEREASFVEAHAAARKQAIWRMRWQRIKKRHVTVGWRSVDEFVTSVGDPPSLDHKVMPRDPMQMLGPNNFEWKIPPGPKHDLTTKEGRSASNREYRKKNMTALREKDLIKNFGITLAEYQEMFISQNGCCAICKKPETAERDGTTKWLAVDHNHSLGKGRHSVRALLCGRCNPMLGYAQDDPELLLAAAAYLESHASPSNVVLLKKEAC